MSIFIDTKALGGVNFIRADRVIAVTSNDPKKCNIFMQGSANSIPVAEPVEDVVKRIEAALATAPANNP